IIVNSTKGITFEGPVFAKGTTIEPILFTSNESAPLIGDWKGLVIRNQVERTILDSDENYVSGPIFENVIIEYTGYNTSAAVKIEGNVTLLFDNCTIQNVVHGFFFEEGL